jgi:transposase
VHRHALRDNQWARLQKVLPPQKSGPRAIRGDRLFIEAVLFRAKTGLPWRDLPERFGPWKSVYNRFANWARKNHWAAIFRELKFELDETGSIVDGSVIRSHQDSSGGKGGSNAMLWAALEEVFRQSSMPSSTRKAARSTFTLTPGQRHEMTVAEELLAQANGKALIGDTGYDSNTFVQAVRDRGMKPIIHSKPERKKKHRLDRALHRKRYLVEVFFHRLKRFRAIATRYEKTARNYLALVQLACAWLWLS